MAEIKERAGVKVQEYGEIRREDHEMVRAAVYGADSYGTEEAAELAEEIRTYIVENLSERNTIQDLAVHFHVSQTKLKETFRKQFGVPVYAYSREARMKAAARDLMTEDISVTELAGRYGYDNASKFAKAFREINGLNPRDYRKANYRKIGIKFN